MKYSFPIESRIKRFQLIKCLICFLMISIISLKFLLFCFKMSKQLSQARIEVFEPLNELLYFLRCSTLKIIFDVRIKTIELPSHLFEKRDQICQLRLLQSSRRLVFGEVLLALINFAKLVLELVYFRNRRALN